MANQPGHVLSSTPMDIASGITVGTDVTWQNVGGEDAYFFEGSATERDAGQPNLARSGPYFDPIEYTVGTNPIWAWVRKGNTLIAEAY